MKTLVIINPASGSSDDDFRALVESELRERGAAIRLKFDQMRLLRGGKD